MKGVHLPGPLAETACRASNNPTNRIVVFRSTAHYSKDKTRKQTIQHYIHLSDIYHTHISYAYH